MTVAQIRRELRKRSESLFFTEAERALLAVLEFEPDQDGINYEVDRTRRRTVERIRKAAERAWNDEPEDEPEALTTEDE